MLSQRPEKIFEYFLKPCQKFWKISFQRIPGKKSIFQLLDTGVPLQYRVYVVFVLYVFQELVMLGFSSLYKNSEKSGYSVVKLINNLYELLQLQIKNNQVKDDLEAR